MPDIFVSTNRKSKKNSARQHKVLAMVRKVDPNLIRPRGKLAAFSVLPADFRFETQTSEEPVVLFLRRHWITNLTWVMATIAMLILPLILPIAPLIDFMPLNFRLIFIVGWYLLILTFSFEKFLGWFFNIFIVTDERVVDIDFFSLIYKQIADAGLNRIQDITYRVGGTLGSVFNYGTILIQTAGNEANIEFEDVPRPAAAVRIINELIGKEEQEALEGRAR